MSVSSEAEHAWFFLSWEKTGSCYLEGATVFMHYFLLGIPIPLYVLAAEDYKCLFWKPLAEVSVLLVGEWAQDQHEVLVSLAVYKFKHDSNSKLYASRRLRWWLWSFMFTLLAKGHSCICTAGAECDSWRRCSWWSDYTGEENIKTAQKGGQVERQLWDTPFSDGNGEVVLSEDEMNFSLQLLMGSGQSVGSTFRYCSTTYQLSGDQYRGVDSNLSPMYLKLVKQCEFRTERGTDIRESQINTTYTPTCLYVLRLHPVLIYPQVTTCLWPSILFLTDWCTARNKKETIHLLHSKEQLCLVYTKLFCWASKANQTFFWFCFKKETSGRGFSAQAISNPYQAGTVCGLWHQPLPLLCMASIMDGGARTSFLMLYSTTEDTVFPCT